MRTLIRSSAMLIPLALLLGLGACSIEGTTPEPSEKYTPLTPEDPYLPPNPDPQARKLVILHTNDEHSHLLGFSPMSEYPFLPEADGTVNPARIAGRIGKDQQTVGGLVRRQYLINKIREEAKDPVLLLSAGDVMMGTVFHAATAEGAPDYLAMAMLGYDFVTLGNHELDWGPDVLAASINTVHKTVFGGAVPVISSNIHFDAVKEGGPGSALKALYGEGNSGAPMMPWATRTLANGLKVGILGATGYEASLVAAGKGPIGFSSPTNGAACSATVACEGGLSCVRGHCVNPLDAEGHVAAMAAELQPVIDLLRSEQKVDLVIALTHLGKAEDQALATYTQGIDVIVGGHSHDRITPMRVPSAVGGGETVIVQAGEYGSKLGQLTLSVAPDGAITVVEAETALHLIDHKLDPEIYAGTNLAANPPVLSLPFERGLKLTGSIVGPVLAGLNAALKPALGVNLLDPVVSSDHDIVGEIPFKETNLMQLVTDAERAVVAKGTCHDPATWIVSAQANGVIRESLRFGPTASGSTASAADVFGVLPLGASPWGKVAAPGFPVTQFHLSPLELFIGAEIGVTKGLESDSFFLSYAGMRVEYDTSLPPFDKVVFATKPMEDPGGRIRKIELERSGTWETLYEFDVNKPFLARWSVFPVPVPGAPPVLVKVISNLYLIGFLDAFGLNPRDAAGNKISVPQTVLCQTMAPLDCSAETPVPAIASCMTLPGSTVDPIAWPYPEVKEWGALLQYLAGMPPNVFGIPTIPSTYYSGEMPASPRVKDVTP